jgi:hypothetical protein
MSTQAPAPQEHSEAVNRRPRNVKESINMNMSISRTGSMAALSASSTPVMPERAAFHQLAKSLRSGDLDAAKQAYASVIKNAPEGATWNGNSQFAQIGRDLIAGDVGAAQSSFRSMVKSNLTPATDTPPTDGTPISTVPAGGVSGTSVDLVA